MNLSEAKARLRIPDLWARLELPGQPKTSCQSPFREDRHASFSVAADGLLFHDFATGESGDAVDFLQIATGLSRKTACRKFIEMAGGGILEWERAPLRAPVRPARPRPTFPDFEHGSQADFARLARLRNLSIEGLRIADERGLLWFATLHGFRAWIITDGERVNAQARRLDGGRWEHLEGAKTWTLPGSWASWPIGITEARPSRKLAFTEGGGDFLAAFHFAHCENREREVAAVAMLGASLRIHAQVLPLFSGKQVRLFPHPDEAGQQAAERWTRQLEAAGAQVDAFSFRGLRRTNGEPVADLNDLSSICPDDFEAERGCWEVMP